jgi:hypothetical protein
LGRKNNTLSDLPPNPVLLARAAVLATEVIRHLHLVPKDHARHLLRPPVQPLHRSRRNPERQRVRSHGTSRHLSTAPPIDRYAQAKSRRPLRRRQPPILEHEHERAHVDGLPHADVLLLRHRCTLPGGTGHAAGGGASVMCSHVPSSPRPPSAAGSFDLLRRQSPRAAFPTAQPSAQPSSGGCEAAGDRSPRSARAEARPVAFSATFFTRKDAILRSGELRAAPDTGRVYSNARVTGCLSAQGPPLIILRPSR